MVRIPADQEREPLARLVAATQLSDAEMTVILRDAARESEHIIKRYGDTFSARVRAAQLDLARTQRQMWATVGSQVSVAIGDGVDAAAESVAFLNEVLMDAVGGTTAFWSQSLLAQARSGIPALLARRENGIGLSDRVYRNSVLANNRIGHIIDGQIASGASAREIANRIRQFIDPATPGGASYAAMRLGRTELNNAFHTTSKNIGASQPWVNGQKWNLSGSHPKPDACDEYAHEDHDGLGPGVFKPTNVPGKPHPQCLCFITPVTPSREAFVKAFNSGQYDDYISGQMGCSAVA